MVSVWRYCCLEILGKGPLKIDDDGTGPSHSDRSHQKITSLPRLNADTDPYAVAPREFSNVGKYGKTKPPGFLSPGADVTVEVDRYIIDTIVGDFGPLEDVGEISVKAAHDLDIETKDIKRKGIGPVPFGDHSQVTVKYYTCKKTK